MLMDCVLNLSNGTLTRLLLYVFQQPLPNTWNGDLLGYVLMYRQAENTNYMEVEIPVDSTEKVLQNLVKFVNYEFLVKAFNAIGSGPTSTPVTVFVGEAGMSVLYSCRANKLRPIHFLILYGSSD